jgi:hypothetical protein
MAYSFEKMYELAWSNLNQRLSVAIMLKRGNLDHPKPTWLLNNFIPAQEHIYTYNYMVISVIGIGRCGQHQAQIERCVERLFANLDVGFMKLDRRQPPNLSHPLLCGCTNKNPCTCIIMIIEQACL